MDNKDVYGQIRGFRSDVEDGTETGSLETVRDEASDGLSMSSGDETEGGETRDSDGKEEGGDVVRRRDANELSPPPSPPSHPRANFVKILRFFDIVKHHYAERPSVYATFMEVIKDFGMTMYVPLSFCLECFWFTSSDLPLGMLMKEQGRRKKRTHCAAFCRRAVACLSVRPFALFAGCAFGSSTCCDIQGPIGPPRFSLAAVGGPSVE